MATARTLVGSADPSTAVAAAYIYNAPKYNETTIKRLVDREDLLGPLTEVQTFENPAETEAQVAWLTSCDHINLALLDCELAVITSAGNNRLFCRKQRDSLEALAKGKLVIR